MDEHRGKLVLEDGAVFPGLLGGKRQPAVGEVRCITLMTGYLETLTDPCMMGTLLCFTYPTIGNYGVYSPHGSSPRAQAQGMIVRESCPWPSQFLSDMTLQAYLEQQGVTLLEEVDTRSLMRHVRHRGSQKGVIVPWAATEDEAMALIRDAEAPGLPQGSLQRFRGRKARLAVLDCGASDRLIEDLQAMDHAVTLFPWDASLEEILAEQPEGVILSDGPETVEPPVGLLARIHHLSEQLPLLAMGRGHQLLSLAWGNAVEALEREHRGGNHPIVFAGTPRIPMTRQNHGLAVTEAGLDAAEWEVTARELHDKSVEALHHRRLPIWSLQYYPSMDGTTLAETEECAAFWRSLPSEKGAD